MLTSPSQSMATAAGASLLLVILAAQVGLEPPWLQWLGGLGAGLMIAYCVRPPESYRLEGSVLFGREAGRTQRVHLERLVLAHVGLTSRGPGYVVLRDDRGGSLNLVVNEATAGLRSTVGRRLALNRELPDEVRRALSS